MKTVLIIEDNQDLATILVKKLKEANYHPVVLKDGWETLSYILKKEEKQPAAVILDLMLPGRSGHELLNSLKSVFPETKIFIYSAHKESFSLIPRSCVEGFFVKTDGADVLIQALDLSCVNRTTIM